MTLSLFLGLLFIAAVFIALRARDLRDDAEFDHSHRRLVETMQALREDSNR